MEALEYINSLIEERDELKKLCKAQKETIQLMKRELLKKDKKIIKLEKTTTNTSTKNQKEIDKIKSEFESLKVKYADLQYIYGGVVEENDELKSILNSLEKMCDSD